MYPTYPTFANVYLYPNVALLTPFLQMYIFTQMYPTYLTFTNVYLYPQYSPTYPTFAKVYLYPNVPRLPHFCKCVFVTQCNALTPLLQMYICTLMYPTILTFKNVYLYPNYPNYPYIKSTCYNWETYIPTLTKNLIKFLLQKKPKNMWKKALFTQLPEVSNRWVFIITNDFM